MTITRETLELAALAGGHLSGGQGYGPQILERTLADGTECYREWRPHLDDGDAARLAVRLDMTVMLTVDGRAVAFISPGACLAEVSHDGTEPDKLRAWREAVVLCAAAVGEKMKGGA